MIRALIVTNMWPSEARPALGAFVADQVAALQRTGAAQIDVFAFGGGGGDPRAYARAAVTLARRRRAPGGGRGASDARDARGACGRGNAGRPSPGHDVVHAHFGLSAWPALAARGAVHAVTLHGTDVVHPRSRALTLAALPSQTLVAAVSQPLADHVPRWATRGRPPAILPTGVDLERFAPDDRAAARRALGLKPDGRYLLLPADPARAEKRADRARALAQRVGAQLLTLGAIAPHEVPRHINAADAVLVTSERESFGLAALEALACQVPVLSTPVGAAPQLLADVPGTLCAPFDERRWAAALADAPERLGPEARARASAHSTDACAARVIAAWRTALAQGGDGTRSGSA